VAFACFLNRFPKQKVYSQTSWPLSKLPPADSFHQFRGTKTLQVQTASNLRSRRKRNASACGSHGIHTYAINQALLSWS